MGQCLKKSPEKTTADEAPEHVVLDLILPKKFTAAKGWPTGIVFIFTFLCSS